MNEIRAVRHKMYCDDLQTLVYMWKLGLYPVAFAPVDSRRRLGFPTYEYTTETKLPWTRNEELTLTHKSRLLDREIAHEEESLHILQNRPPELLPVPSEVATVRPVAPLAPPVPPVVPQAQTEPQAGGVQDRGHKEERSTIVVTSPAEPQTDNRLETGHPQLPKLQDSDPLAMNAASSEVLPPWYRTVAGVVGIIVGCTIVMFFCFRFCARQRDGPPPTVPQRENSDSTVAEMYSGDKGEVQRRPTARKEGYAQVTDEQAVREPDSDSWWDHEGTEGGG